MDTTGVVISGHPETLSKVMKSSRLDKKSPSRPSRSRGLYNAPHLYSNAAVGEILAIQDLGSTNLLFTSKPEAPIFSPSRGSCYESTTTLDLLEQMITDILTRPQDMRLVLKECASMISSVGGDCRGIPIGPITNPTVLISALHKESQSHVSVFERESREAGSGRRGTKAQSNSKIAIVGMSGRFPGASDIHEFWQVLQKGRDMHKKVRSLCLHFCSC